MTLQDTGKIGLLHEHLTRQSLGAFFSVHDELGYGFLESVYETAMLHAIKDIGLDVRRQVPIDVWFRGRSVGAFKADIVVESAVIVELKAVRNLVSSHEAQLLNALRATNIEVGLLLNFGHRPTFKRLVFSNSRKHLCVSPRLAAADH
jgi:GxxExxY protein